MKGFYLIITIIFHLKFGSVNNEDPPNEGDTIEITCVSSNNDNIDSSSSECQCKFNWYSLSSSSMFIKICLNDGETISFLPYINTQTHELLSSCPIDYYSYNYECYSDCSSNSLLENDNNNQKCKCKYSIYSKSNNRLICYDSSVTKCPELYKYRIVTNTETYCSDKCPQEKQKIFLNQCQENCPSGSESIAGTNFCKSNNLWCLDEFGNIINENDCPADYILIVKETNECVQSCPENTYNFNNYCYYTCPENSGKNNTICDCLYYYYLDENNSNNKVCLSNGVTSYNDYKFKVDGSRQLYKSCPSQYGQFNTYCVNKNNVNLNCDENRICECKNLAIKKEDDEQICLETNECPDDYPFKINNRYCVKTCSSKIYYVFNYLCSTNGCPSGTTSYEIGGIKYCKCNNPFYKENNKIICNSENKCNSDSDYKKLILDTNECVQSCPLNTIDFNDICYLNCPEGTRQETENINDSEIIKCVCNYYYYIENNKIICLGENEKNENYPFFVSDSKKMVNNCNDENMYLFYKTCVDTRPTNTDFNSTKNEYFCVSLYYIENNKMICLSESTNCPNTYKYKQDKQCVATCDNNRYLFNNECLLDCNSDQFLQRSVTTDSNGNSIKICQCLYYWKTNSNGLINCYSGESCSEDEYKLLKIDTKECTKICNSPYYRFNNICYNNECPGKTEKSNDNKCVCEQSYYIDSNGNTVCIDYSVSKGENDNQLYSLSNSKEKVYDCSTKNQIVFHHSCIPNHQCVNNKNINNDVCICLYNYYIGDDDVMVCLPQTQNCSNTINYLYLKGKECVKQCDNDDYIFNYQCLGSCSAENLIDDPSISNYKACKCSSYWHKEDNLIKCDEGDECIPSHPLIIDGSRECVNKCNGDYIYEFNQICYKKCPSDSKSISKQNNGETIFSCECNDYFYKTDDNKIICINANDNEKLSEYNLQIENSKERVKKCTPSTIIFDKECININHCAGSLISENDNNGNTIEKCICNYYYYYDVNNNNKMKCTDNESCPSEYPFKIFSETNENNKQCVKTCQNEYQFLFNLTCYSNCPENTILKSGSCVSNTIWYKKNNNLIIFSTINECINQGFPNINADTLECSASCAYYKFNLYCYKNCPEKTITNENNRTCSCNYQYYINDENQIECISWQDEKNQVEAVQNYKFLIEEQKRRVKNCKEVEDYIRLYDNKCILSKFCGMDYTEIKTENDETFCDCINLYKKEDEKTICFEPNIKSCPANTYLKNSNSKECVLNCKYFIFDGKCVDECPKNAYHDYGNICNCNYNWTRENNTKVCLADQISCNSSQIFLTSTNECSNGCQDNKVLFNNECRDICPENTEEINKVCICKYDFYFNDGYYVCFSKDLSLENLTTYPFVLSGGTPGKNRRVKYCSETINEEKKFIYEFNGKCYINCQEASEYSEQNSENTKCICQYYTIKKNDGSIGCTGIISECDNYTLEARKECVETCPFDYPISFNKRCLNECDSNSYKKSLINGLQTCECNYTFYKENDKIYCNNVGYCENQNNDYKYLIDGTNECVRECNITDYKFNEICYKICPKNTVAKSDNGLFCLCEKEYYIENNKYYCIPENVKRTDYPYILKNGYQRVKNCSEIENTVLFDDYCYPITNNECPNDSDKTDEPLTCECGEYFYRDSDNEKRCVSSCPSNFPYLADKQCVKACPQTHPILFSKNCLSNCENFSKNITLLNGDITCECLGTYYNDSGIITCNDNTKYSSTCPQSVYNKLINGTKECVMDCKPMYLLNNICYSKCPEKYKESGETCDCAEDYYYNTEISNNKICIYSKEVIDGYPYNVTSTRERVAHCPPNYKIYNQYQCVESCPNGSYQQSNGECSCVVYTENPFQCHSSCPTQYPLQIVSEDATINNKCVESCPYSNTDIYYLYNSKCYQTCPSNTYGTRDIFNQYTCTCKNTWYRDENGIIVCGESLDKCDNNGLLIVETKQCLGSMASCSPPDSYFFNNKCYRKCPKNSGNFTLEVKKIKVPKNPSNEDGISSSGDNSSSNQEEEEYIWEEEYIQIYEKGINKNQINTCKCLYKWYYYTSDEGREYVECLGEYETFDDDGYIIPTTQEIVRNCDNTLYSFNKTCIKQSECNSENGLRIIDSYCICENYYIIDNYGYIHCLDENKCPEKHRFTIYDQITQSTYCIHRCPDDYFQFNNTCVKTCPDDTIKDVDSNQLYICKCKHSWYKNINGFVICNKNNEYNCDSFPTEYNLFVPDNNECVTKCPARFNIKFNNICYEQCPENSELSELSDDSSTCKCIHSWFQNKETGMIFCLGINETKQSYDFQINSTKELVDICDNRYYFTFNHLCLEKCPENSKEEYENDGLRKNCVCKYLYAIDLNNDTVCFPESEVACGKGKAEDFPFYVQAKNQYCQKFCPDNFSFKFNNYCYDKCPNHLVQNEDRKTCECKNLFYFNETSKQNECAESRQICINNQYFLLDSSTNECLKGCKPGKVIFDNYCVNECPDNAYILKKDSIECECIDDYELDYSGKKCLPMVDKYDKNNKILDLIDLNILRIYDKKEIITMNNIDIEVSDISNQIDLQKTYDKSLTQIDFTECEKKLRSVNDIPEEEKLILAKLDINPINQNSITSAVEYRIYRNDSTRLDLSVCGNFIQEIKFPIINESLANIEAARQLAEQNVNMFDPQSSFYFDYCSYYSINGTDIPVKQRREKIFVNINACEKGCKQSSIDIYNNLIICQCNFKTTTTIDNSVEYFEKPNTHFITTFDKFVNYRIIKCYKLLSKIKEQLKSNIGLYIGFFLILINLILVIFYFTIDLVILKSKIFKVFAGNPPPIVGQKNNKDEILSSDREIFNINNSKKKNNDVVVIYQKKPGKIPNYGDSDRISIDKKILKKNNEINNNKFEFESNEDNRRFHNITFEQNEELLNLDKYKGLTFEEALEKDHKFFLLSVLSIFISKMDIIMIFYFREKFQLVTLLLSLFFFGLILDFTINAFMYTDDIASESFNNGGGLDMQTSLALSLLSNLICYIIIRIISHLIEFSRPLEILHKEVKKEEKYNKYARLMFCIINQRVIFYFIIQFIIMFACFYYLFIFCCIYKNNQINLIKNYFLGVAENIIIPLFLSIIIATLRYFSFKYRWKSFYYSANFIDSF